MDNKIIEKENNMTVNKSLIFLEYLITGTMLFIIGWDIAGKLGWYGLSSPGDLGTIIVVLICGVALIEEKKKKLTEEREDV